jgi:hypothetical protein
MIMVMIMEQVWMKVSGKGQSYETDRPKKVHAKQT